VIMIARIAVPMRTSIKVKPRCLLMVGLEEERLNGLQAHPARFVSRAPFDLDSNDAQPPGRISVCRRVSVCLSGRVPTVLAAMKPAPREGRRLGHCELCQQ